MNTSTTAAPISKFRSPVIFWAVIGAIFLAVAAYVWGSWMLSPVFRPVPVGSDPLPDNVNFTMRLVEFVAASIGAFLLGKFVFLPLIKERRIPMDGLLLINFLLIWWMDPIDNYINYSFMYNGHAVNMGGWANFIPGWRYPNHENLAEPLFLMGGFYLAYWMLNTLFGCWFLRFLQSRWPSISVAKSLMLMFIPLFLIDLIAEVSILRTGIAAYPGVVRSLSLFPGEVYQFPLYEAPIIAFVCTGWICLRYFRDDKGRFFVEKGIDHLKMGKTGKGFLSFFALAGFIQPFFLIGYFLPYNLFVIHADTFPAYPSYMRTEICGEGTQYACPSDGWVPIPGRNTKIIVGPNDQRLPQTIRDAQGISALGIDPYAKK